MEHKPSVRAVGAALIWGANLVALAPAVDAGAKVRLTFLPQVVAGTAAAGKWMPVKWEISQLDVQNAKPVLGSWNPGLKFIDVVLPSPGRWRLRCLSTEVFCPEIEGEAKVGVSTVVVPTFPVVSVTGTIVPPPNRLPPREVILQARLLDEAHRSIEILQRLPIEKGAYQARLPMAPLDLRIAADGFAPSYIWSFDPRRPTADLGRIATVAGGSLSGRIVRESGTMANVSLRLAVSVDQPLSRVGQRLEGLAHSIQPDKRGFFQFQGLAPGHYRLDATARALQGPVMLAERIEIVQDAETRLDELALRDPVRLEVVVTPAVPPQGWEPEGEGWRIRLRPRPESRVLRSVDSEFTDAEGRAVFHRVNPGRYRVCVEDARGTAIVHHDLDLLNDQSLPLPLDLVSVRGVVRLGSMPLRALVTLHNLTRGEFKREADDNGRFQGWIQRAQGQELLAQIKAKSPRVDRVQPIKIDAEASEIDLDITVEDYRIFGDVREENGDPVPNAEVAADLFQAWTGRDGRFEIRGLEAKRYAVVAAKPGWLPTARVEVDVSAQRPAAQVSFTLKAGREGKGRLVNEAAMGIPGARLDMDWIGLGRPIEGVTDVQGQFLLPIPAEGTRGHFRMSSSVLPLWATCVSAPGEGEELLVRVPALGSGEIEASLDKAKRNQLPLVVRQAGGVLTLSHFSLTRAGSGTPPIFKATVAAGSYALIDSDLPQGALESLICSGGELSGVSWTTLTPGQSIRLEPQRWAGR
jgi:hypothetical protein